MLPGHFTAVTIGLMFVLGMVAWWSGADITRILGLYGMLIGIFFADQSMHLAQEAHNDPAPTAIERWMQRRRWLAFVLGFMIAAVSTAIVFRK